jgi:hypothetical protein
MPAAPPVSASDSITRISRTGPRPAAPAARAPIPTARPLPSTPTSRKNASRRSMKSARTMVNSPSSGSTPRATCRWNTSRRSPNSLERSNPTPCSARASATAWATTSASATWKCPSAAMKACGKPAIPPTIPGPTHGMTRTGRSPRKSSTASFPPSAAVAPICSTSARTARAASPPKPRNTSWKPASG